jgi:bifunctional lysine-specific demethylase and histidyl-hydroxylase NO66
VTQVPQRPQSSRLQGFARRESAPADSRLAQAGEPLVEAALALALAPVSKETFLARYWEQQPLVVSRDEDGRFDRLLTTADVERLVCSTAIRHPAFRLVKEGAQLPLGSYTEDVSWRPEPFTETARVDRVLAEFEAGATIVLQALHLSWEPLALFCRGLEHELGEAAQANAYYTPRSSQGFAVHHDTHDVLVLQVAGEKQWLLYQPALELPTRDQRYSAEPGGPGEPSHELTLAAGDTLYLPRGWLHEAVTSASDSLHITVGINVYTWLDAFRSVVESCRDDVEFRRSVPADGEGAQKLVEALAARLQPADVARRKRRRLVAGRRPVLTEQLTQLRAVERLRLETRVERRPTVLADLELRDGRAVLAYEGKELSLPARLQPELEHIARAAEPFRAVDLPGELDEAGRLVLVKRLVREGFLRLSEPGSGEAGEPSSPSR